MNGEKARVVIETSIRDRGMLLGFLSFLSLMDDMAGVDLKSLSHDQRSFLVEGFMNGEMEIEDYNGKYAVKTTITGNEDEVYSVVKL